ncbi:MAG: hypothetical protein PHQ34_05425 [Methanothrix sp.]|nr:hypothetical protein [Methanothrix sp.]
MQEDAIKITGPLMNGGKKIGTVEVTDDKQGKVTSKVQFEIPIIHEGSNRGMIKIATDSDGNVLPSVSVNCPVSMGDKSATVEITVDEKGNLSANCALPAPSMSSIKKLF